MPSPEVGSVCDRSSRRRGGCGRNRDHLCRSESDAEQTAFAFGDDLELDRVLVEAGRETLELTKRRPLRLTDRLTGRLDAKHLVAHRRPPPPERLRLTRRGGPAVPPAGEVLCGTAFGLPPPFDDFAGGAGGSLGGVRDVFLSAF